MAYTVLSRRYRSSTFDDLIGQDAISGTLKKAIETGRIAHAYLFCGTRGTGKTSTARILAKALNCEKSDGPTPKPCGVCPTCVAIARGDDIDTIEIDAASNTGVDNVRQLIENSAYRPARSRFKVYIIDEVHMLSRGAFNALLKTLEEPPSHVKFILATTDPEKIPPTILSRCQRYDFRNIPAREVAAHLKTICKQEGVKAQDDALLMVARAGAGSMRDSLSLLDRLLSVGETQITIELIERTLGLPKAQVIYDLAQAIGEGNVKDSLERVDTAVSSGLSYDALVAAMAEHFRTLLLIGACGKDSPLVEAPGASLEGLVAQAERYDAATLSQNIALLEELRRTLRSSSAGRAIVDATVVRLALAEQFLAMSDVAVGNGAYDGGGDSAKKKVADDSPRSDELPRSTVAQGSGMGIQPTHKNDAPDVRQSEVAEQSPSPVIEQSEGGNDDLPAVGKVWEGQAQVSAFSISQKMRALREKTAAPAPVEAPADAAASSSDNAAPSVEAIGTDDAAALWSAVLKQFAASPMMHSALRMGRFELNGETATLYLPAVYVKTFDKSGRKEQVSSALARLAGRPVMLRLKVDETVTSIQPAGGPPAADSSTPGRAAPPQRVSNQNGTPATNGAASAPIVTAPTGPTSIPVTPELKAELETDPMVKAAMELFGAQIVKVTR